jgi:NADPH-dependent glutamate synthase beta subunit-like oxidoreductase
MINWKSNVFPGILGRTCDRPCEPACRRGRVEETPVAICRLKRVAADFKDDVKHRMPKPLAKNGKRIALVGGAPPRWRWRVTSHRSAITAPCSMPIPRRAA